MSQLASHPRSLVPSDWNRLQVRGSLPWACLGLVTLALAEPGSAQILETKLLPPGGSVQGRRFGNSVALTRDWAITKDLNLHSSTDVGKLFVYGDAGGNWVFSQELEATPGTVSGYTGPSFGLGTALDADGDWMVATTPADLPVNMKDRGSAHVYNLQGGTWVLTQKLVASDLEVPTQNRFGESAAISGDTMVIGEPYDMALGSTLGPPAGSAYVFERSGSTWVEVAKLYPFAPGVGALFANSVAIDGDTLVAGAPADELGTLYDRGAAYVFQRVAGEWVPLQTLLGIDTAAHEEFGVSVAIEGDWIFVGSWHTHPGQPAGTVYVFHREGGTWVQTQELFASDPANRFADELSVDGGILLVSAFADGDVGAVSGSAYAYRLDPQGQWNLFAKLLAPDAKPEMYLGYAVDVAGRRMLVRAPIENEDSGSAYVFDYAPDSEQYGSCPSQGPCGNHDDFGGCLTSSGHGGVLSAAGSASVVLDELHFEARWLPANKLGLVFMGGEQTAVPFGDGQLCVASGGAGVWRFGPPQSTGAQGVLTLGPNVVGLSQLLPPGGQIAAGQTWNFQAWFRDPAGPCGNGSNLTNGVRVTFGP